MIDTMLNSVDETFGNTLAELIKEYVTELVDHQTDIITDSDWFYEKVEKMVDDETFNSIYKRSNLNN